MRKKIIVGVASLLIVCSLGTFALSDNAKKKKDDLFKQVELFSDVLSIIQSDYVDEVPPRDLIYGALRGMLSSLDPHSQFMDPDSYNELKVDTEGQFGGLGIEITVKDGLLTVVTPIEDTPAWRAGVKSNDRIVKINNELTRDMTLSDAVKHMRGKPGETVTITVLRESEKKILEFNIVRDIIKIKNVKEPRILQDGIGYLRLIEFRENTSQDIDAALDKLKKDGMTAFILDLRNNPGGLLDQAVNVSEKFVEKGKMIVYTKGRKAAQNLEFLARSPHPILDIPVAVLINEGSASGSEIVAGCLQDYKRAIIIGTKSFGKGSVQTVIPLSDGSALRLTTSKYFTPAGRQIHGKGIVPDIVVEKIEPVAKEDSSAVKPQDIFEKIETMQNESETKNVENVKEGKGKEEKIKDETKKEEKKDSVRAEYTADNQLMSAVNVLKAVNIYKMNGDHEGKK